MREKREMGGVGGNTRTLAWLPQVQVAAAKGRSHRMHELRISACQIFSYENDLDGINNSILSRCFLWTTPRGTLEFAQSTLTKDSNKDLEMYLPESNNFEEHVL